MKLSKRATKYNQTPLPTPLKSGGFDERVGKCNREMEIKIEIFKILLIVNNV